MGDLTALIARAHAGDAEAREALFSRIYDDLRVIARGRLSGGGRNTYLDTSALVNEAYLRLAGARGLAVEDRHRYFAYASQAMRSVIVDFVRARAAQRRGGGSDRITLTTKIGQDDMAGEAQILRVHEALDELSGVEPQLVRLVEMRYFAGLTEAEVAAVLGVSERKVRRDWQKARMLLAAALT